LDSAELVEQYMLSAEFGQTVAPVTRLYFAYFNRIPDFSGLMFWIGSYKQGAELVSISDAFAGSDEFNSTYGSLNNSDFVTLVYQNVLGRDPDQSGLDYWTGILDSSTQTRGQVMVGFSESPEYQTLMTNKIYVTMTYIGLLRRSPDQSGFDYWVNIIDQGATGLGLIDGFLYSTEYQGRFDGSWVISSLEITGPGNVNESSSTRYSATATWADGRTSLVSATWSDNSAYANIDNTGMLTTADVNADTHILLNASYSSGGVIVSDTLPIAITVPRNLSLLVGLYDGITNGSPFGTDSTNITFELSGQAITITDDAFFSGTCIYTGTVSTVGDTVSEGTYQCSDFSFGSWTLDQAWGVDTEDVYISITKDGNIPKWIYGMSAKADDIISPLSIGNISDLVGSYSGINNRSNFLTDSTDFTVALSGSTLTITDAAFFSGTCIYTGTLSDQGDSVSAGTYQCSDFTSGSWTLRKMKIVDAHTLYISILKDGYVTSRMFGIN